MTLSIKRILLSAAVLVFAAAAVAGATGAFFSDVETSTGNSFSAGAIDLHIDNESYVTSISGETEGQLVESPATSWVAGDLMYDHDQNSETPMIPRLFFNFTDVKPGDRGEDTISIHVNDNNAYACMDVRLTATDDNGVTEPEGDAGDNTPGVDDINTPNVVEGLTGGELQNELFFVWWADDGDNVYETCEGSTVENCVNEPIFASGYAASLFGTPDSRWTLADSQLNVWGAPAGTPIPGDTTVYVAKYWCLGSVGFAPLVQDGQSNAISPLGPQGPAETTGFTCNGAAGTNMTQTDSIKVDVEFYAVQSRNNGNFRCNIPEQIPG